MRLIGYSRRILDRTSDVEEIFKAVESKFGAEDYEMELAADPNIEQVVSFSVERGAEKLKDSSAMGFFRENVVGVLIDNQAYRDGYSVYPHSMVQIETIENDSGPVLATHDWLSLAETLTATAHLDLALVMGTTENAADYYRTPLGCGIGFIKVFWISCFGSAYSELIPQQTGSTSFFKREDFGANCKAFVSARSYEAYRSAPPELLASQRREIGEDLFNRLPVEKPWKGGACSILNPKAIFRFLCFLCRQRMTNWRRYQAKMVPEYYRRAATSRGAIERTAGAPPKR